MASIVRWDGELVLVHVEKSEGELEKFILLSARTNPMTELRRFDPTFVHVAYDLYDKILMGVVGPAEIATFWSN